MPDSDVARRPAPSTGSSGTTVQTSSGPLDTSGITAWGVDANPQNDPTYSYRDRSADDHSGTWLRPSLQKPEVELLMSVEHKQLPAVFGTSAPPRWVSGALRRLAFRWTESNWVHWLLLIAADRIDMVEGVVADLARLKIPNVGKEMGLPAAWRCNKKGVVRSAAIAVLVIVGIILLFRWL